MDFGDFCKILEDKLWVPDLVMRVVVDYACDQIDFFTFPSALQRKIEDRFCHYREPFPGLKCWVLFDKWHGPGDQPAFVWESCQEWYKYGKYHREHMPAVIQKDGCKWWYRFDRLHRDNDLPAVETVSEDGVEGHVDCEWWVNGNRHRNNDMPAVVSGDRSHMEWWRDNKLHRDGGKPAVEWSIGHKEWWVNGKRITYCVTPSSLSQSTKRAQRSL